MANHHFIVSHHDLGWQYAYRGTLTGPFATRDAAIDAAIDDAISTGEAAVEVFVQDADRTTERVWRPDDEGSPPPLQHP